MTHCCFKQGCEREVQYICLCLSSETYSCESHFQAHLKLPNRTHAFNSILGEPSEWTKVKILEFLTKEKQKNEKLKKIVLTSFNQYCQNPQRGIDESLEELDSELKEISSLTETISQFSDKEEDPHLNQLMPGIDNGIVKAIILNDLYKSVRLFCSLRLLRNKRSEILNKTNNNLETEQNLSRTCSLYQNHDFNILLSQAYQEYISAYEKLSSLYFIREFNGKYNLYIYNTASEIEEMKIFNLPKLNTFKNLWENTEFTVQLPNGELLFRGIDKYMHHFIFIIDKNYRFYELPPGGINWKFFTGIYFNRSVYFFGKKSPSSCRLDLDSNKWTILAEMNSSWRLPMERCGSVIFNRNILINRDPNSSLLLYSIDIDSFSKRPYKFYNKLYKILVSAEERLYLFECGEDGMIYESEIRDEYAWNKIANSRIQIDMYFQAYFSYNKGGIYISITTQILDNISNLI